MHKFVLLVLFSLLAVAFSAPTDVVVKQKKESSSSSESKEQTTGSSLAEGLKKKAVKSSEEVEVKEGAVKVGVKPITPLQPLASTTVPVTSTSKTIEAPLGGTK